MEKNTPHCKLATIKALVEADKVRATGVAYQGARDLGIYDLGSMCADGSVADLGQLQEKHDDPC